MKVKTTGKRLLGRKKFKKSLDSYPSVRYVHTHAQDLF